MMLGPDTKAAPSRVLKRKGRLSKLNLRLPFLRTCFKSCGKQRRDMVKTANRAHIEIISKVRLIRLLKGNIIVSNHFNA